MAMSIYHHKRRRVAFMVEATPGTAIAAASLFDAANMKVPMYDIKVAPGVQNMDRNPDGLTFDSIDSVRWGEYFTLTFSTDMYTSGTAGTAPGYAGLFKACGLAQTDSALTSNTFTVNSDVAPTYTFGVELIGDDGTTTKRIIMGGCLGDFTLATDVLGKPGRISWTFTGKAVYVTGTLQDVAGSIVSPVTYDNSVANLPQLRGVTLTDGGVSVQANNVSFARGLATEWETLMSDQTGYKKRIVASSTPKLTIDPAKMPTATQATIEQLFNGTSTSVVTTWGSVAGKRVVLTMGGAQKESLSDDARGVTSTWGTTFRANRTDPTGNGDNAVTIAFT